MRRRAALVVSLAVASPLAGACGKTPVASPAPTATDALDVPPLASASAPAAAPASPVDPRELLRPAAVSTTAPARRTLFTWTTREQAAEVTKSKLLLMRTESASKGASYYDQILAERTRTDKLAALLRTKAFARARFAWPAPWATLLGWEDETYGDVLVGVTLKPEALLVTMRTTTAGLAVVDMENNPVTVEQALAHPERIAAVHFVNDEAGMYRGSFAGAAPRQGFREYVLCNESMIEEWSIGSPREAQALAQSIETADALSGSVRGPSTTLKSAGVLVWNPQVTSGWIQPVDPAWDAATLYEHALAIPSETYFPKPETFHRLSKALRSVGVPPPIVRHRPSAAFPVADTRTTLPPPRVPQPKAQSNKRPGSF